MSKRPKWNSLTTLGSASSLSRFGRARLAGARSARPPRRRRRARAAPRTAGRGRRRGRAFRCRWRRRRRRSSRRAGRRGGGGRSRRRSLFLSDSTRRLRAIRAVTSNRRQPEFASMTGRETIAFHIVTGFLGAGKTTLINRLLRSPELAGALGHRQRMGRDRARPSALRAPRRATRSSSAAAASAARCAAICSSALRDVLTRRDSGALPAFRPDRAGDDGARRACADSPCAFRRSRPRVAARARRRDDARRRGQRAVDLARATRKRAPDRARRPAGRRQERSSAAR